MSERWAIGGREVRRVGYGAMRLTSQPGNFGRYPDWEGGKALLRRAVELGVELIDTAQAYGNGWNERLIAEALHPYPEQVLIATKGGIDKRSPTEIRADGRPEKLRGDVEGSLRDLRVEVLELWQWHRRDPGVPLGVSLECIAKLREEGKIRNVGLSNVTREQVEEAMGYFPVVSVQNRFYVGERGDEGMVGFCGERGMAYLAHGPLGANAMRAGAPVVEAGGAVEEVAREVGVGAAGVALGWLLQVAPNVVVIPGTTSVGHLEENVAAGRVRLSEGQMGVLGRAFRGPGVM